MFMSFTPELFDTPEIPVAGIAEAALPQFPLDGPR
jgi:hypothetical protein